MAVSSDHEEHEDARRKPAPRQTRSDVGRQSRRATRSVRESCISLRAPRALRALRALQALRALRSIVLDRATPGWCSSG